MRLSGRTAWTRVATRALEAVARGAFRATPRLAVTEDREAIIFSGSLLDWMWRLGQRIFYRFRNRLGSRRVSQPC